MRKEIRSRESEGRRQKPAVGRKTASRRLLTSGFWVLTSALLLADAPDKTRDLTKARQDERDRAVASIPIIRPAEMYRQYFTAMKAGRFPDAANHVTEESLRSMKAALVRALREAPLDELAKFLRDGGFKSARELQLSDPGKVFNRWMRTGWRVRRFLERIRQHEIASVEEAVHDNVCDLTVELKPVADAAAPASAIKETITCEYADRVWRLRLETPLEATP
jgi:hypothetical protein